jgi:L-threonylcarbamoyladenylate synthase
VTRVLEVDGGSPDPAVVLEAADALIGHALVVFPTETLYALGGVPTRDVATRVRLAKGRADAKPLPLVAAGALQARALCREWSELAEALAARFWPGPLTLVLPASWGLPNEVTAGTGKVAVRVPGLALARALCERAGPLLSTSANLQGQPPPARCAPALAAVGEHAALALDAGPLAGVASTILELTPAPRLLRAGAVPLEPLAGALREAGVSLQTQSEETKPP